MKTLFFASLFITVHSVCICQTNQTASPVRVLNWGERVLLISDDFLAQNRDSIIAEIGIKEFEEFVKYSNVTTWPAEIAGEIRFKKDSIAKMELFKKLDKLKMTKIASFTHYHNGKKLYRRCILKVRYNDNQDWDKTAKWDSVYFLFWESSIEEL